MAGLILLAAGCSQIKRPEQADVGESLDAMELLHGHLPSKPVVTVAEAYRVILILADGEETHEDFASREQALLSRGIVRKEWNLQRDQCIDRGSVAYMVYRVLEMKGGANMVLLGSWGLGDRRYALRELTYRGLMRKSPPYQVITGGELVFLLRKADEYMADQRQHESQDPDLETYIQAGDTGNPK